MNGVNDLPKDPDFDPKAMLDLIYTVMPFGKYRGRKLLELPEPYLNWFSQKGFPEDELGKKMAAVYEIKVNGLEGLFKPYLKR